MVFLDHNVFITELSKLYTKNSAKGSVWISMKRVTRPINTGRKTHHAQPPVCLVRATDGKRKIACAVSANEHVRFHMDLFTIIKASTTNLQKAKRPRKSPNNAT